jgi:internalin A
VQREGQKGSKKVTYNYISRNGVLIDKIPTGETIIENPVNEIVLSGTKPLRIDLTDQKITNKQLADMVDRGEIPRNVSELILCYNQISDITPLKSLTGLKFLRMGSNQISDLTPLSSLTGITDLYLNANPIRDISPLKSMTNLQHLFLGYCSIDDITVLQSMTKLELLNISGNNITEFSSLGKLINLRELWVLYNPGLDPSSASKIRDIQNLVPKCKIHIWD